MTETEEESEAEEESGIEEEAGLALPSLEEARAMANAVTAEEE